MLVENPEQFELVRGRRELILNLVSEIIRYQTPVLHMRRTARHDTELAGRRIAKGDKVVMWYISGNRDETRIDRPDESIIDRPKPRQHLAFGAGIHRCVGDRLAEQQIRILWEEVLNRDLVLKSSAHRSGSFEFHPRHPHPAGEDCQLARHYASASNPESEVPSAAARCPGTTRERSKEQE